MGNVATPPRRMRGAATSPASRTVRPRVVAWGAIAGLIALVVGGLAARAGGVLELVYPLAALAVGGLLYRRYPDLFVGFTLWVWLLTPEVRRLVDYQQGWNPTSPVMLAPYLVTALTLFSLLYHLPKLQYSRLFAFGPVFLGLLYAFGVGLYKAGLLSAAFGLLNWLLPAAFAFYLAVGWREYPRHRQVLQRTFVWAVAILGSYGLLQFFNPPAWDRYWMISAPINSIGSPEPFEVRVFSTLNSPSPFAIVMTAGLLVLLSGGGGPLRWFAAGVGYTSFLLSLVRAAWGSFTVGLLFVVVGSLRSRPWLLASLLVAALAAWPLVTVGPIAEVVEERLQTVTDLDDDTSFNARLDFYAEFAPQAFLSPVGQGLGTTGLATKLGTAGGNLGELGNFDSGIMNVGYSMGWPGTLLYAGGVASLLFYAFFRGKAQGDLFLKASQGVVITVLLQLVFTTSLVGVDGMVFWTFLGVSLAAQKYRASAARTNKRSKELRAGGLTARPRTGPDRVTRTPQV